MNSVAKGADYSLAPALLTYRQACHALSCGTTKLRQLIDGGHLAARISGRRPMILAESVRQYVAGLPPARAKAEAA